MDNSSILKKIKESETNKVKVAITDIDGILRGKYINKEKFLSAAESGFGFCNVVFGWDCADLCYENSEYTGWHTGYPDAQAQIDLNTLRHVPWDEGTPFFLADFIDDKGSPLSVCPRQLLKKVIKKSEDSGFHPSVGLEYEWFNFSETPQSLHEKKFQNLNPITPGMFGYSILRSSLNQPYFADLFDLLLQFEIPMEGVHTETGPGVYEAAIQYSDALTAADRGVLFKSSVKEIAYAHGIIATFMAKWDAKLPGCSGHIHQSLWDRDKKQNAFYDDSDPHKMSATFRHFLAGQMHCLPEILPLFAPNVNSYKRLVEGLWAPTKVLWGVENRTTAFRVIPGSSKSTRLETRVGGADMNAYLSVAASIASGLYGIENKLELPPGPFVGNAYEADGVVNLPRNLYEATERFSKSEVAKTLFGEEFVRHFSLSRFWEWQQFQQSVSDWELERYFEII